MELNSGVYSELATEIWKLWQSKDLNWSEAGHLLTAMKLVWQIGGMLAAAKSTKISLSLAKDPKTTAADERGPFCE